MKIISSDTFGGKVVRRILPNTIVLIFLICWLHLQGELLGVYDSKFGVGILLIAIVIIFIITLYLAATFLIKFEKELLAKNTELQNSVQDFKTFIQDSPLAICFVDADTKKIIYVNSAWLRLLGYLPEEIDSLVIYDFMTHPKDAINATFNNLVKSESCNIGYRVWKRKDGNMVDMFINASGGRRGDANIVYVSGQNVSDLKQSERDREKLISDLLNKNNELMQFNYIVSHNLRSPIANLIGLSNYFTLPNRSEEDDLKSINYIRQAVNKMDDLIKDLNVILSMRSAINTHKEIISIQSVIQNISDTLQKEIAETNCIVETVIPEDSSKIYVVKNYLESILYNLISNAIKFHAANRNPHIIISTKKEGSNILISVSDNGIGIDLENQGKDVFGLYKRFHFAVEGKGLGLHLTKTQVEALGGTIKIESEVNKGTTFHITLPHD